MVKMVERVCKDGVCRYEDVHVSLRPSFACYVVAFVTAALVFSFFIWLWSLTGWWTP